MPPRKRREQAADAPSGADQAPPSPSAPDVRSEPLSAAQGPDVRRTTRPGLRLRRGDRRNRFRDDQSEASA